MERALPIDRSPSIVPSQRDPHSTLPMNWQTPAALAVVALTAAAFAWPRLRPRRLTFTKDSPCGCGTSRSSRPEGIVISGRRGETPRITFKP